VRERKYLILTILLVGILMVESSPRRPVLGPVGSDAAIFLVAIAVFFVVFQRWRERTIAFVAAMAAMVANWSHYLSMPASYERALILAYHGLMAVFLGFAVAVILSNIFAGERITADGVLGAVCGYLLAAGAWANVYAFVELTLPGSFNVGAAFKEFSEWQGQKALLNYFSVVTLTTMGYGDITPVRSPATALAMLEAVFGQFYIAVVVAQLVGLRLAQAFGPKDSGSR